MALQDQTLANTMAKVGMEAKRRRNAEAAVLSVSPGAQHRLERPWWAQDNLNPLPSPSGSEMTLKGLGGLLASPGAHMKTQEGSHQAPVQVIETYERLRGQGVMPDGELVNLLKIWQKEGIPGVRRLVEAGVAPAVVLGILSRESTSEQTPGGQTGAPAGSGLPMLGV